MQRLTILLLSTLCLAASGCETTKRAAVSLRPDLTNPERFVCVPAGTRPKVQPEYVIDWNKVTTVDQAKAEFGKFVATVRTREGVVAGYVLDLEGKHFTCWNNMQWQRDYYSRLPAAAAPGGSAANDVGRILGPVAVPNGSSAVLTFRS